MDSNINNCENSPENIPSNLSVLLEKIQKEQNSLSARVNELEREKTGLEEVITRNRKISDRHEEKLTSLAKRIFIVTQDIKSRKAKYDSLAGGDDTENRSVLESLVSRIEDSNIKTEISEATKVYLTESSSDLHANWERIADDVCELEREKEQGPTLCDETRSKEEIFLKLSELKDKEGEVELLHDHNNSRELELQQLVSEKEKLEKHCDSTEQISKERRDLFSRLETEIKLDEGRLQTQKERILSILESVGDGE